MPSISYAFGLFDDKAGEMVGICTYGKPFPGPIYKAAFGGKYQENLLELNRLCVNDGLPKNALSYFVSSTLKMLPWPSAIVSYADSAQHHHGYIYQATNWVYTGMTDANKDYAIKGMEGKHGGSVTDMAGRGGGKGKMQKLKELFGEENIMKVERSRKYRYFFFVGDKRTRKDMARLLKYKPQPYPKGDNKRYDASFEVQVQGYLF